MSFATVGRISPQDADESTELAGAISYWNEDNCPPAEWIRRAEEFWGAGLTMRRGEEMLGFAIFGPVELFSRAESLHTGLSDESTAFLACVSGDRRTKKHLLGRMFKDLRHRGITNVEAITSDLGSSCHVSTGFLLENGWRPVRRIGYLGRRYTLMRVDLGSAVEVGELARDIIGRVKIPKLKNARPVPGEACVQVELSSQLESPENGKTAVFTAETPSGVVA